MKTTNIKAGIVIECKAHPEWGTWTVQEKYAPGIWNIRGNSGCRTLDEGEVHLWRIA